MIELLFVALLGIVEGLLIAACRERYKRDKLRRFQDETGKADEEIVCENAMVVWDGREISWYDKDEFAKWVKK